MKASELVEKLNALIAEHGDLEVGYYAGDEGWTDAYVPSYEQAFGGDDARFTV